MKLKFFLLFLGLPLFLTGQNNFWKPVEMKEVLLRADQEPIEVMPGNYQLMDLNLGELKKIMKDAPEEGTFGRSEALRLSLPTPTGESMMFEVWEVPVMMPGLAAKYPELKAYAGRGVTGVQNRGYTVRFDLTYNGFSASFFTPEGKVFIEPYANNQDQFYISYYQKDFPIEDLNIPPMTCGWDPLKDDDHLSADSSHKAPEQKVSSRGAGPVNLRIYRFALSCTGEYAQLKGGTHEHVMSSFVTSLNYLNAILESETAVRLLMVDDNDSLINLDPATDPFFNTGSGGALFGQNSALINNTIGVNNYDIGHIFNGSCDVGGVANRSSVCTSNKANGVTCHYSNNLKYMTESVMAHEVGHQFSCGHSWNNCPGSEGQYASTSAFEPGSGSTIMSYAGLCGAANNTQGFSSIYYNIGSLEDIIFFTREGNASGCATIMPTSNNDPIVTHSYEDGFYIPISTPFELMAEGFDPDGDVIRYCWEQYNIGPQSPLGSPIGTAPIFRTFPPTLRSTRVFPRLETIINNITTDITEILPTYTRNLTFRCTVRDNNPEAGGTDWETVSFEATGAAGPFFVSFPTGGETWEGGDYRDVKWEIANTDQAPVNCERINIKLSLDGGYTYPITLMENTPNDGSEFVVIPNVTTNEARIKVEAADNIFFSISKFDFAIQPATEPGFLLSLNPTWTTVCLPSAPDFDVVTESFLGYDSLITMDVIGGLPPGATYSFSNNPFLPSEGSVVTLDLAGVSDEGIFPIEFIVIAPGKDTATRFFNVEVINPDFSALELLTPELNKSAETQLPTFTWTDLTNADFYDFRIATSPDFNEVVETVNNLTEATYTPSLTLDESTIYYWQIRPHNECTGGEFGQIFAFQTVTQSCAEYTPVDVPINISAIGSPTINSVINIPVGGAITDVNVTRLKGTHDIIKHIDVFLIGPSGNNQVTLFSNFPCNTTLFNLALDDEAPLEIQCPPIGGANYRPQESLSKLFAEDAAGDWTLRVKVNNTAGAGGKLEDWTLELCSNVNLNGPFLVNNDTLHVKPGFARTISNNFLLTDDTDNEPFELTYILVSAPEHGTLYRGSEPLVVGSSFEQTSLNFNEVLYTNNSSDPSETDQFRFTVNDGEGGWVGITQFHILMDPDADITSTKDLEEVEKVVLFPNPARDFIVLEWEESLKEETRVKLINAAGQLVRQYEIQPGIQQHTLSTTGLPSGFYFLEIESGASETLAPAVVKKVVLY